MAHPELIPKGPADIKIAISGLEMHSGSDVPQDSVKERDREMRSSDDSSVQSELSQGLLQGNLYLSKMNTHKPFVLVHLTLNWNIS